MRGVSFDELLDYSIEETNRWRDWFERNPAVLDLACDIAGAKTVRDVVLHIAMVQVRCANRLREERVTEYAEFASSTAAESLPLFIRALKTCAASLKSRRTMSGLAN